MRASLLLLALPFAACAGGSPPAPLPPSAASPSASSSSVPVAPPAASPSASASVQGPSSAVASPSSSAVASPPIAEGPCAGSHLVLETVFADPKCRHFDSMFSEVSGPLEAALSADPPNVAPGATTTLKLVLENKGSVPVVVAVPARQATRPPIYVRDAQGKTVVPPPGTPVLQSNPNCAAVDCGFVAVRATIAPGGKATWKVPWKASKLGWPKGPVMVPCCSSGVEPVVVGPLGAGSYDVSIALPGKAHVVASTQVTVGP